MPITKDSRRRTHSGFVYAVVGGMLAMSNLALAKASSDDEFNGASGREIAVSIGTRLDYYASRRVMITADGTFAVCQRPREPEPYTIGTCRLPDRQDKSDKWTPLSTLMLNGYRMRGVQVNEARDGPSLVVVWELVPGLRK